MKVWPDCQEVKVKGQGQGYQTKTPIKGSFNVYMCIKV